MKEDENEEEDWEASMDVKHWLKALQWGYWATKLQFERLGNDLRRAVERAEKEAATQSERDAEANEPATREQLERLRELELQDREFTKAEAQRLIETFESVGKG
jgi:hypothetical protein